MALYITGDTHGDFRRFLPERFPEQERLTKEDLVLICGDFGGIWYGDNRDDEELDFLEARPFTTLFVTGNHENYDALNTYPLVQWHGGTIRRIRPTVLLLERGQVFDLGGKRIFTMGGSGRGGTWTTSSPTVPPPASRTNCSGPGPPRMLSRTSWKRSGSGASSDTGSSGITMMTESSGNGMSC